MATATASAVHQPGGHFVEVSATDWVTNVLCRWLGIRAVPHLPCRFDCEATRELGQRLMTLGRKEGFGQELAWLEEALSGPIEWSALHGIAEIRTSFAKIVTRTDPTATEFTVRLKGLRRPMNLVRGTRFPYNLVATCDQPRTVPVHITNSTAQSPVQDDAWVFRDNAFVTMEAMDRLHRPIVTLARRELEGVTGNIIDLGCGNGMLLKRICAARPGLIPHGIEINASVFPHIERVWPGCGGHFRQGDMFSPEVLPQDTDFVLAILMVGRLLEVSPERADRLKKWLTAHASRLLVYVYPDWSKKGLKSLAERAGLPVQAGVEEGQQGLVLSHGSSRCWTDWRTSV
jgi:hypothetical protein